MYAHRIHARAVIVLGGEFVCRIVDDPSSDGDDEILRTFYAYACIHAIDPNSSAIYIVRDTTIFTIRLLYGN